MAVDLDLLLQLLALAGFIAVALAVWIAVRRLSGLAARSREVEGFRAAVADLERRVGESLDPLVARIDLVRRQAIEPAVVADELSEAGVALATYTDEARAIATPAIGRTVQTTLVAELERAARALETVAHGCAVLATTRRGTPDTEAQISIKRGYLNLLHAREAIGRQASAAATLGGQPVLPRLGRP